MAFTSHTYEPDSPEAETLKCIGSLSNHIIAVSNSKTLQKYLLLTSLKISNPEIFKSAKLYLFALRLTCEYDFKLPVYRFIQDLFDPMDWSVESIEILNKSHGLRYTTQALPYQFAEINDRFQDSRKSSNFIHQDVKPSFKPAKMVKGF